jgi:hypothetical protein
MRVKHGTEFKILIYEISKIALVYKEIIYKVALSKLTLTLCTTSNCHV